MVGTVTQVHLYRGFAFISVPGMTGDIFAHVSQFQPDVPFLEETRGRRVEFSIGTDPKGRQRAERIRAAN